MREIEIWVDTNDCPERYHEFRRQGLGEPLKPYHIDGKECETMEFSFWPHRQDSQRTISQ